MENWIKQHRKKCAKVSKELNFWYSSKKEDLKHLES